MTKVSNAGTRLRHISPEMASRIAAAIVIGLGASVLVGWALGMPWLKSIFLGAVEMKVNTAVGLVISGCALLLATDRRSAWISTVLAFGVGALGMASLSQYIFGWNLGIDELVMADTGNAYNVARGRMSPYTAASFVAVGLAILALSRLWSGAVVWAAAAIPIGIGGVSTIGYLWNAHEIVTDTVAPPVAIHTALAMLILGAGLLATNIANKRSVTGAGSAGDSSIESRVLTGLVGGLLILFVAAGYIYREEASYVSAADLLQQNRLVSQTLSDVYAESTEAQSALRAFVITGDKEYLDEYQARAQDARSAGATLRALTAGNVVESSAFNQLHGLLRDRLNTMSRVLAAHSNGDPAQVQEEMEKGRTFGVASAMKSTIANIESLEAAELYIQRKGLERSRQTTLLALLAVLAGSAGAAAFLLRGVRNEIAARRAAEQQLQVVHAESEKKHLELVGSHELLEVQAGEIRIANQFLHSVVENLPHMVFVKEAATLRFVRLNRAGHDLLGFTKEELLGKSDGDFFPKEEAEAFNERDRAVLASGRMSDIAREVIHTKNKGQRVLHTMKIPIFGRDGKPLYLLGISEDISEAEVKQLEILRLNEELKLHAFEATSANRAKGIFLATMSHEIRTPMNGMLGMLELLSLTRLDADQKATLEVVRGSSTALLRIIDDILDFSKMEAGMLDIRSEPSCLRKIVEDMHQIHVSATEIKGLQIRCHVDPRISAALTIDPLRLRQILNNFITNAIKFTLEGSIDVMATLIERSDGNETIEFSVTDTGIGISQDDQKLLFEPFNQGPAATAQRFGGTGLGLSICRRLAEMMGGRVMLESTLGKGTRMTLTLRFPIANDDDLARVSADVAPTQEFRPVATIAPSADEAEAAGNLVLVVDDHPTNRALISRQLHTLGIACEVAGDGVEAMRIFSSRDLALIITDCQMPNMNGYELARGIRGLESPQGKRIPILACTANALDDEWQSCVAAGMDDLLVKPVDLRVLWGKMQLWLPATAVTTPSNVPIAVTPAPMAAIDFALVAATWGGVEPTREILAFFRDINDKDAEALYQAASAGETLKVVLAAHRMVGASKMVSAHDFALACEAVEAAGRARDPESMSGAMTNFGIELGRLNKELDDMKIGS